MRKQNIDRKKAEKNQSACRGPVSEARAVKRDGVFQAKRAKLDVLCFTTESRSILPKAISSAPQSLVPPARVQKCLPVIALSGIVLCVCILVFSKPFVNALRG
ncbi:hypothetical protein BaRGS_00026659 [Batillaria attramentaria]|uniref:Stress-associated endoplasmic reticulum protein n=1 Tax=Batillaria attramentaria TaxID=370345 RepID=A0ABD0K3V1_9CAEN